MLSAAWMSLMQGKAFPALSSRWLEGLRKGWAVGRGTGRGTGRGSHGTCSRLDTPGWERKRLLKAWELEHCSSRRGCRVKWKPLGMWG